jgi:DNA-binding LytR/AlgR family response regulator
MEWLKISSKTELFRVAFDDVAYVEAQGNYSVIHLINGNTHTLTLQIKDFEDILCTDKRHGFVRLGRSFIVNKRYVLDLNVRDSRLLLGSGRFSTQIDVKRKSDPREPSADSRPPKDALRELKDVVEKQKEGSNK